MNIGEPETEDIDRFGLITAIFKQVVFTIAALALFFITIGVPGNTKFQLEVVLFGIFFCSDRPSYQYHRCSTVNGAGTF